MYELSNSFGPEYGDFERDAHCMGLSKDCFMLFIQLLNITMLPCAVSFWLRI